jgi:hypothetical protein
MSIRGYKIGVLYASHGQYDENDMYNNSTQHDTTRHDTTRHDTTRHDTTRHDTTRHDQRHDTTNDTTRPTTRHDTTNDTAHAQSDDADAGGIGTGSAAFEEFLGHLGDKVVLKGWNRYRAGLNVHSTPANRTHSTTHHARVELNTHTPHTHTQHTTHTTHTAAADLTGTHSIYTQHKGWEVMFHVSTYIPFTEEDKQQVRVRVRVQLCVCACVCCRVRVRCVCRKKAHGTRGGGCIRWSESGTWGTTW